MAYENHWLPDFNFNAEEWEPKGCTMRRSRSAARIALACAVFKVAVEEGLPAGS